MSLTYILSYNNKDFKEFRDLLTAQFPTPKFKSTEIIKAAPGTTNYMLIGKAFDYLLRFNLEKKYKSKVYSGTWVSEKALRYFKDKENEIYGSTDFLEKFGYDETVKWFEERKEKNKIQNAKVFEEFENCKKTYNHFINSKLKDKDKIIKSSLFLSRLDDVVRAGPSMKQYITFLPEDKLDIEDLRQLVDACDLTLFKPMKKLILNPTFGEGSKLVGGADADMIIDDTLVDIKATKELKLTRPYFNQLLGYYLLYLIGGVDNHKDVKIKNLGIYFARHNVLWTIKVDDIGDIELFGTTKDFLMKKVKKTYRQQNV